jgi:hypothetical protein
LIPPSRCANQEALLCIPCCPCISQQCCAAISSVSYPALVEASISACSHVLQAQTTALLASPACVFVSHLCSAFTSTTRTSQWAQATCLCWSVLLMNLLGATAWSGRCVYTCSAADRAAFDSDVFLHDQCSVANACPVQHAWRGHDSRS